MCKIKTSIIVPVYNTEQYLGECFESIFSQTQTEMEIIAVNDGSTDNSLCVLEHIKRKHPELIIYSQENKGLGAARNKGMELATGEYIYFIDSDDCLVNTAMETCYHYAKSNALDILMFDAKIFGVLEHRENAYDRSHIIEESDIVLTGEEFACKYWLKTFSPSACLVYMSLDFLKKNNLNFIPDIYYEDNEFYCKIMLLAARVMYIPYALYRRRCREHSITTSAFSVKHARDFLYMIQMVDKISINKNVYELMHVIKLKFLQLLINKCVEYDRCNQYEFADALFKTALHICGEDICNIDSFQEIEILYQISNIVSCSVVSQQLKQIISHKKKEIVESLFSEIPLRERDCYVGIYGTGRNTERFLDEYQMNIGDIEAKLIFIDTNIISGQKQFRDCNIYNVDDIGDMSFKCIVIASSKYEAEIVQTMTSKYGTKFKLIRLESDLNF